MAGETRRDSGGLHLHFDALGGAAGDMILAALLHARPDLTDGATALAAAITPGLSLELTPGSDGGLSGLRLRFALPGGGHGPHHYADYVAILCAAAPDDGTRHRACDILRRLGEAEARVHGVALAEVHFHEVADWDSVADVLLCAWVLERIGVETASIGPLPLGSGRIETRHGIMPVPAPATMELLRGFNVIDDGIPGERVTPTGAAILAHLAPGSRLSAGPMRLDATGYGFGHRRLPGLANTLRASLWRPELTGDDVVGVISFAVDDQSGEDLAVALDRIRSRDGVIDALTIPAFGKKGRMVARIEILCRREAVHDVARACLSETTTIGLRMTEERRMVLPRHAALRDGVRIKRVERPDGAVTAKAEMDDIAKAGDRVKRDRARKAAERPDDSGHENGRGHPHCHD